MLGRFRKRAGAAGSPRLGCGRQAALGSPKALHLPPRAQGRVRPRPGQEPWAWDGRVLTRPWRSAPARAGDNLALVHGKSRGGGGERRGRADEGESPRAARGAERPSWADAVNRPAPAVIATVGGPRPGRRAPAVRAGGARSRPACARRRSAGGPPQRGQCRTSTAKERFSYCTSRSGCDDVVGRGRRRPTRRRREPIRLADARSCCSIRSYSANEMYAGWASRISTCHCSRGSRSCCSRPSGCLRQRPRP
jgi:hypothetical protein